MPLGSAGSQLLQGSEISRRATTAVGHSGALLFSIPHMQKAAAISQDASVMSRQSSQTDT